MFFDSLKGAERRANLKLLEEFEQISKKIKKAAKEKNIDLSKIKITLKR